MPTFNELMKSLHESHSALEPVSAPRELAEGGADDGLEDLLGPGYGSVDPMSLLEPGPPQIVDLDNAKMDQLMGLMGEEDAIEMVAEELEDITEWTPLKKSEFRRYRFPLDTSESFSHRYHKHGKLRNGFTKAMDKAWDKAKSRVSKAEWIAMSDEERYARLKKEGAPMRGMSDTAVAKPRKHRGWRFSTPTGIQMPKALPGEQLAKKVPQFHFIIFDWRMGHARYRLYRELSGNHLDDWAMHHKLPKLLEWVSKAYEHIGNHGLKGFTPNTIRV